MRYLFLFLSLATWFASCSSNADSSTVLVNADFKPIDVDLEDLLSSEKFPQDTQITISYDPFFKQAKRFKAYSLAAILQPLVKNIKDTSNLRITFTCTDGYAPNMSLSKVLNNEGYIAVQDLDQATNGKDWADSLATKFRPFYLVWQGIGKTDETFAWPFGLAEIRIASFIEDFADAYPMHKKAAQKGFNLFQLHCMKCHSINKVGGVMGPEFNYPKSITEYWQKEDIWNFLRNPQSYRYSAKMPAIGNLSSEEFEEVYGYLKAMKGVKPQQ